jgi:hypothetical protein
VADQFVDGRALVDAFDVDAPARRWIVHKF